MTFLDATWLLIGYVTVIGLVSFTGGHFANVGQTTHRIAQLIVSFIAGFILGLAIFHLLPHALAIAAEHGSRLEVMIYVALGVVVMIFFLHVFQFHSHESLSSPGVNSYGTHKGEGAREATLGSFWALTIGLGLHTFIEAVTLGVTVELSDRYDGTEGLLPGLAMFIAITLHKPLDAYSVLSLAQRAGYTKRRRIFVNVAFALLCPIVAVSAYFIGVSFEEYFTHRYVGIFLSFATGTFLCIALSDLLPEIQFHRHDKGWLALMLLLGLCFSLALFFVEVLLE